MEGAAATLVTLFFGLTQTSINSVNRPILGCRTQTVKQSRSSLSLDTTCFIGSRRKIHITQCRIVCSNFTNIQNRFASRN